MKESFFDAVDTNANFLCPTPTHFVAFLAFHTHSLTMTMTITLLLTMSTCTMKTLVSTLRRHFATLTLRLSHTTPRCRVATNPLCYCACTPLLYYATAPFSLFSTVFLRLLHHIAARLRLSNVLSAFVLIQNIKPNCKKTKHKKTPNKQTNKQTKPFLATPPSTLKEPARPQLPLSPSLQLLLLLILLLLLQTRLRQIRIRIFYSQIEKPENRKPEDDKSGSPIRIFVLRGVGRCYRLIPFLGGQNDFLLIFLHK